MTTPAKPSVYTLTPEQLSKLPKYAQDAFRNLERERATAVEALNEWKDDQTESPIMIDDHVSTGEERGSTFYKRYVQARAIRIKWHGVELNVRLTNDGPQYENAIALTWNQNDGGSLGHVALIPTARQSAILIHPRFMRWRPDPSEAPPVKPEPQTLAEKLDAMPDEQFYRAAAQELTQPTPYETRLRAQGCTCDHPGNEQYPAAYRCPVHDPKPAGKLDDWFVIEDTTKEVCRGTEQQCREFIAFRSKFDGHAYTLHDWNGASIPHDGPQCHCRPDSPAITAGCPVHDSRPLGSPCSAYDLHE